MSTTISHLLCQGMLDQGIGTLFCLPGVQNDDFFNVLVDFPDIRPIMTRHEQACSYMSAAAAQATGTPQAYCTVPGQGVLNAAAGHSTAFATAARVLAIHGQNRTDMIGQMHGMLHELPNQVAVVDQISKHTEQLREAGAAPAQIAEAFRQLAGGYPAPVSVECPLDLWSLAADMATGAASPDPAVDTDAIERAAKALAGAKRPMIVLGGGAQDAAPSIARLAGLLKCPVSALRQGKGAYDERQTLAVPSPVAHEFWKTADVVVGIGTRFMWHEMVWGTDKDMTLIQITADPGELNRRGRIDIPILAMTQTAVPMLVDALDKVLDRPVDMTDEVQEKKAAFEADVSSLQPTFGDVRVIEEELGEDGVYLGDLTQISYAAHYIYRAPRPRSYLFSGYAGTLGWGVPAGIGAQIACPDRRVISVQGDGGFMYGATEIATAVKYNVPIVMIVYNDGAFGNVQRIQEDRFGHNRTIATDLVNPDMVKFAESFGATGIRASEGPEGLRAAIREGFRAGGPVVVEVPVTERYPSPWPYIFLPTVRGPKQGPLLSAD